MLKLAQAKNLSNLLGLFGECQGFVLFWEGKYILLGIFLLMYFADFKSSSLTDEVHRPVEKINWLR